MEQFVGMIIQAVIGGVITGIAAYSAIRVELKYLRRDVEELREWRNLVNVRLIGDRDER